MQRCRHKQSNHKWLSLHGFSSRSFTHSRHLTPRPLLCCCVGGPVFVGRSSLSPSCVLHPGGSTTHEHRIDGSTAFFVARARAHPVVPLGGSSAEPAGSRVHVSHLQPCGTTFAVSTPLGLLSPSSETWEYIYIYD